MKSKKLLTSTNIIILICILVYAIDRFILGGSISDLGELNIQIAGKDLSENNLLLQILGLNYGKLYDIMALKLIDGKILNFWQPLTYIFMHQFIIHIIVNLVALFIVGNNIEKNRGYILNIFVFIMTGIIGVLIASLLFPNDSIIAGSSIGVFGLIGATLGMCFTEKGYIKSFSTKSKIYLAIYGLIFTYTSGSWTLLAHNVGLILGIVIYLLYYYLFYKKQISKN